jgi:hypothetical protein
MNPFGVKSPVPPPEDVDRHFLSRHRIAGFLDARAPAVLQVRPWIWNQIKLRLHGGFRPLPRFIDDAHAARGEFLDQFVFAELARRARRRGGIFRDYDVESGTGISAFRRRKLCSR